MKEAYSYKKLENNQTQCQACNHYCLIKPGEAGKCKVRANQNGIIYSLTYGKPCSTHIDPIEKKPLYHFLANTKTLSIATIGCNFCCSACQNWQISQAGISQVGKEQPFTTPEKEKSGQEQPFTDFTEPIRTEITPERIVEMALANNCPSISYTYTEPTIFVEYALDIMKLAQEKGLKNIWVSNGFFSKETLELIAPYLDAANIDLKSFFDEFYQKYCCGKVSPILENLKELKKRGVWIEITTLIIPSLNDSAIEMEKIANFIKNELGEETPWHISRFFADVS